jgi:hypothetical protein
VKSALPSEKFFGKQTQPHFSSDILTANLHILTFFYEQQIWPSNQTQVEK